MRLTGVQSHRRTSSQNISPSLTEASSRLGTWMDRCQDSLAHVKPWVHWPAPEEYIRVYINGNTQQGK